LRQDCKVQTLVPDDHQLVHGFSFSKNKLKGILQNDIKKRSWRNVLYNNIEKRIIIVFKKAIIIGLGHLPYNNFRTLKILVRFPRAKVYSNKIFKLSG